MNQIRLNKYISECGIASRRKADELIEQGRVVVNGKTVREMGMKIDPSIDNIIVDGQSLRIENKVYFLLNKPKGFVTTTKDDKKRLTVIELINTNKKIFPVGRLDFNTTGVLLLTNDGEFSNLITHPSNKVPRIYKVKIDRPISDEHKSKMMSGLTLDRKKSKFENIDFIKEPNHVWLRVTAMEGRNHFVKNMFQALGYNVLELEREKFDGFTVDNLKYGEYRKITKDELKKFYETYA